MLNVAEIVYDSRIYGPGERTVIWFQGCSIRCSGCINPELISFEVNKLLLKDELLKKIHNQGVTLLGGEPLDQIEIFDFLIGLKKRKVDIILFTGYEWKNISISNRRIIEKTCSLVVTGPYVKELENKSLYLRGSYNQKLIYFNKSNFDEIEKESYEIVFSDKIEIRGRVNKDIFDTIEDGNKTKTS